MLKVLQLSDCHLTASDEHDYRGQDPRDSLRRVVNAALAWRPDLVLATGDLSEDASASSYEFLAAQLGRFEAPVWVTAGNHDDNSALTSHFTNTALNEPVIVHDGDWRVILLNSAKPGEIGGHLSDDQMGLLTAMMDEDTPTLLGLHHQPWPVGSPWIDRYPLHRPEPLQQLLEAGASRRLVVWGHVHQALLLQRGRVTGLSAPSTVSNSLPYRDRFTADPAGPACRWLELLPGGSFNAGIMRPSGTATE